MLSTTARHNLWHEKLLLNKATGHLCAIALIVGGAQAIAYRDWIQDTGQLISAIVLLAIYSLSSFLSASISRFPGGKLFRYSVAALLISIALIFSIIIVFQLPVSRASLCIGIAIHINITWISRYLKNRYCKLKLAYIPSVYSNHPVKSSEIDVRVLQTPNLGNCRFDGLVIDSKIKLDNSWLQLVANAGISGTPVLDARKVHELLEGKVLLSRLDSTDLVDLQPSQLSLSIKRLTDITITLALLPLALPLCLILGLAIRLDSPGGAIYSQTRTGKGNKPFKMYKLRSMQQEDNLNPRFANDDEHRITRLGKWLRKYRLDELPQLYNVLKGEMSLIGPRPEQPGFVESFSKTVPFYTYRHIINPGITGWAQVNQGYTSCVTSTKEKVEHDFYYIKHLSIWLDIMIILRTIRTVFTGSGAL